MPGRLEVGRSRACSGSSRSSRVAADPALAEVVPSRSPIATHAAQTSDPGPTSATWSRWVQLTCMRATYTARRPRRVGSRARPGAVPQPALVRMPAADTIRLRAGCPGPASPGSRDDRSRSPPTGSSRSIGVARARSAPSTVSTSTVPEGTVLGLLGPNGAGKTTTVRILATLLKPDAGSATIAGHDVVREPDARPPADRPVRPVRGGRREPDRQREPVAVRAALPAPVGARRTAAPTSSSGSSTSTMPAIASSKTYSGGMRRRLDLASALIGRPRLLILDEPTTGLDPRSRLGMWDVIRGLVRDGVDAPPDDPVPRGGRRAGRHDRRRRPRQDHRPGHRRRAEVAGRRRADRGRRPGSDRARRGARAPRPRRRRRHDARRAHAAADRARLMAARRRSSRSSATSTRRASTSTTSPSAGRPSTTSSWRSRGTRSVAEPATDEPTAGRAA